MTVAVFTLSLLGAMALGTPIAFALLVCALALMVAQGQMDATILSQKLLEGADSFPLLAIPFFMLTGELMNAGGISKRIVGFALAWVGHIRGGLGLVAVFASVLMAAISGSAAADTAAIGTLLIPMMRGAGYNVPRAAGLIAAGGVIAPVIPPSIGFIMFGVIANVSIGKLFLAGVFPGLLMGLSLVVAWQWVVRRDHVAVLPRQPWAARLQGRLRRPLGAADAVRHRRRAQVRHLHAHRSGRRGGGLRVRRRRAGLPRAVAAPVLRPADRRREEHLDHRLPDRRGAGLGLAHHDLRRAAADRRDAGAVHGRQDGADVRDHVLVVIVGTALDFAPTVMILTPVLMPVIKEAGIDPVYFGVLFIMNNAIGLITPPVGIVLNVICGVAKISMSELMKGLWPFLWAELIVLFLLILFPSLVMLPLRWLT